MVLCLDESNSSASHTTSAVYAGSYVDSYADSHPDLSRASISNPLSGLADCPGLLQSRMTRADRLMGREW
ncbi:hypothetical protein N7481_012266 [Penicillium waksmanii]|uniref:uncharacterized protein n=1 Tax=Penicillium waksmanii TaxID=69791 RepID=UPI0025470D68|nr:uncharacterized protein N7481_012266 [Penicillium waksmanii]KAJ5965552.1 hypothetical protein N7481_012266 [Penicillium waksmanii]